MPKITLKGGQGINYDQPAWELAPGVWSAASNYRPRNGCDERVGGVAAVFTTPTYTPYALRTFDVGAVAGFTRYLVEIGLAKAHCDNGTTRTEITRGRHGVISAITGGGATVTVDTSAAHNLSTGDNAIIAGVVPTSYNTGAGGTTITVTGASQFTYANGSVAAVTTLGYYDSGRVFDFTAAAGEEFTTANLNGITYFNTLLDGCYYWAGNLTASAAQARFRRLRTDSSTTVVSNHVFGRSICSYKDYLFVLGYLGNGVSSATSSALTKKPYDIAWGNSAEPGSTPSTFRSLSSNDAGSIQKTFGALVHGLEWNDTLYVYQDHAIIAVRYTGGNNVFSFDVIDDVNGLLAPNCIANTSQGQVFFSSNREIKIHQGGQAQSISKGVMSEWIRNNIDSTYYARSFLSYNPKTEEVEIHIPTTGNSTCNKVLLLSYGVDGTWKWGERTESGVTCGTFGMLPTTIATDNRALIGTNTPTIGLIDSGTTYFGASFTTSVERTGINLEDSDAWKTLHQSRPILDASSAITTSVYHGSSPTQDGTVTYGSAITYTHNTTKRCDGFAYSGPYMAWKMTTTAAEAIKWRSIDLFFNVDGTD